MLNHLIDDRSFRPLPPFNPPEPFKVTPEQLAAYSLEELVEKRFYIPAADRARKKLVEITDTTDSATIFRLWNIRMSSLLLGRLGSIAREEARFIGELGSDKYRKRDGTSVVPWEFRLTVTGVLAGGEGQNGLGRYYALAREATAELQKAPKEDKSTWSQRIKELGLYVAAILVGVRDAITATEHLKNMHSSAKTLGDEEFATRVAFATSLAYLRIGDTLAAREWLQSVPPSEAQGAFVQAVCSIADADWPSASSQLEQVKETVPQEIKPQILNNEALVNLYQGKVADAISELEKLSLSGAIQPTILLNLFTVYDLQQQVSATAKTDLLQGIRSQGVESLGSYEMLRIGS